MSKNNPLDVVERRTLRNLEAVIDEKKSAFLEVGNALREIRDGELYRETHKTFATYVQHRHDFQRAWAYRLIDQSAVVATLSTRVDKVYITPTGAAALARLPEEQQIAAYQDAVEEAEAAEESLTVERLREKAALYAADNEPPEPVEPEPEEEEEVEPILDGNGKAVPEDLREVFEQAGEFGSISRDLTDILKRITALAEGSAGAFLELPLCKNDTKNVQSAVKSGKPHAVCTYCDGRGCKACRQAGWVNKTINRNAPAESK